jgi:hypothetical protein
VERFIKLANRQLGLSLAGGVLISALVLTPCFWQSRIQAGDLSSHIYNAWLTLQVEQHPVPGLGVATQWTNVLFDLALTGLLRHFSARVAQAVPVAVCVLVFFWGSLFFVRTVAGRPVWWALPAIAMLTYGWLYHSGFFNYYFSAGLCFFGVAFWLRRERISALLILPVALSCHLLPVAWSVGVLIFLPAAKRFPRLAFAASLACVTAVSLFVRAQPYTFWTILQVENMAGFDQLDVFEPKYVSLVFAALGVMGILHWKQVRDPGVRGVLVGPEAQLAGLLSLSMVIMPLSMKVPGKMVLLGFMPNRLSVTVALVGIAVAGKQAVPRWVPAAFTVCMLCFGILLYGDTADYNRLEDRLTAALSESARGEKVVLAATSISARTNLEVNVMTHMIDRACLGQCYSFANYEPSTEVFRLRATGPNPWVTASYEQSILMQAGKYVIKEGDLPLLQVNVCGIDRPIRVTPLAAGQMAGAPVCVSEGRR